MLRSSRTGEQAVAHEAGQGIEMQTRAAGNWLKRRRLKNSTD
jgi:hypothetical protein